MAPAAVRHEQVANIGHSGRLPVFTLMCERVRESGIRAADFVDAAQSSIEKL
jgi:hypothetical protein